MKEMKASNQKARNSGTQRKRKGQNSTSGGGESGAVDRRKRRMVTVDKFIFFNVGRNSGSLKSGTNGQERWITEADKFMRSLSECLLCMYRLNMCWDQVPYFRCCGGSRRNKKFVSVSTVRIRQNVAADRKRISAIVTLVIEEE